MNVVVDVQMSWKMGFAMAEEGQSSADIGVAEAVYSALTSLHSEAGGCSGKGHYSRMEIEMLAVAVEEHSRSSSHDACSHWHMQVLQVVT